MLVHVELVVRIKQRIQIIFDLDDQDIDLKYPGFLSTENQFKRPTESQVNRYSCLVHCESPDA